MYTLFPIESFSFFSEQSRTALQLAKHYHEGQVDKIGEPYLNHVITVAESVANLGDDYIATALLHDIIEDTPVTIQYLRDAGVKPCVVEAVHVLTRCKTIKPTKYYQNIRNNPIAYKVKLADIQHNLNEKRLQQLPSVVSKHLRRKYRYALKQLDSL